MPIVILWLYVPVLKPCEMKKFYFLLATVLFFGGLTRACAQDTTSCNPNFTTAISGNLVSFFPADSMPGVIHQWTFGDSTQLVTAGVDISHQYAGPGNYLVTQTVTHSANHCQQSSSQVVTITSGTTPTCGVTISESIDSSQRQFTFVANITLGAGAGTPDSVTWTVNDTLAGSGSTLTRNFDGPETICALFTTSGGCQAQACVRVNPDSVGVTPPPPDTCTIAFTARPNSHRPDQYVFSVVDEERYDSVTWTIMGPDSLFAGPYLRSSLEYTFPGPGDYDVQVRAGASPGCAVSNSQLIHIDSVSAAADQYLSSYPNPATSQVNLTVNLPSYTRVDIQINNSMGVLVSSRQVSGLPGANRITIPVSNLPTGLYYIEVQYGTTILQGKFQKL